MMSSDRVRRGLSFAALGVALALAGCANNPTMQANAGGPGGMGAGGKFMIGVMKPDGSGERILTEGFHNEGPTWAPNGRVLMFFRDTPGPNGGPQLWTVDLTGRNEQRVTTPSFGSDPAWSPLIN